MDFTNADSAFEIGYFDRGSIDPPKGADVPQPQRVHPPFEAAATPSAGRGGRITGTASSSRRSSIAAWTSWS
jgi:hypothetical protein